MSTPLSKTFTAEASRPYVHVDERGLVICDGRHTVVAHSNNALVFIAATLAVLDRDGRATRRLHEYACGGFRSDTGGRDGEGTVTLYLADVRASVSVVLEPSAFAELRKTLPDAQAPDEDR